jgi:hypothetical protein
VAHFSFSVLFLTMATVDALAASIASTARIADIPTLTLVAEPTPADPAAPVSVIRKVGVV